MSRTQEIIKEVESLPVEQRAQVVDSLLRGLNPPDEHVESAWRKLAGKRLEELRNGTVQAVSGDVVFKKISDRLA